MLRTPVSHAFPPTLVKDNGATTFNVAAEERIAGTTRIIERLHTSIYQSYFLESVSSLHEQLKKKLQYHYSQSRESCFNDIFLVMLFSLPKIERTNPSSLIGHLVSSPSRNSGVFPLHRNIIDTMGVISNLKVVILK